MSLGQTRISEAGNIEVLKIVEQHQQPQRMLQVLAHQARMFKGMLQKSNQTSTTDSFTPNAIANAIDEFLYTLEDSVMFLSFYRR